MKDKAYGADRTRLAYLQDIDKLYGELISGQLLSAEETTNFKHARTRHQKAFKSLKQRLPEDFKKIKNMLKDNIIVMKPKMQELIDPRAIYVTDDRLRGILEVMINDHCVGCTTTNWKNCHIHQLNDDLDVSSEHGQPDGVCVYAYMAAKEKALNPTYGTIFKGEK